MVRLQGSLSCLNPNLFILHVVENLNKHDFITQSIYWAILYLMGEQNADAEAWVYYKLTCESSAQVS